MKPVKFESVLKTTNSSPPWHILHVPKVEVAHFGFRGNLRRVICSLNGTAAYNCSLFPSKGDYFITLSKQLRQRLSVEVGDTITIELKKDESPYGMPIPEEFTEVLRQDPTGHRLFQTLSPGDQRLMLKLVVFVKDTDRRIARALAGIDLLKRSDGKFNYEAQHLSMRIAGSLRPK